METVNTTKFVKLSENELLGIHGGIAPILIGVGIVGGLGGGFAAGYGLARAFG
ncbi:class IIb bacteriocin, lactobin A/cerein 7B family [Lactobacillus sp. LL6]|uniref:class IIb bacteriocin, lactobin A/cerein 7B family n=1 Tax=unclassified Lactobacillus TaxID=2620435 RepID=UPI001185AD55|nr:class IIb bacteriocin, lactobin A/cerein 7B family [Lactobacillus sp. LL6]TSO26887.1 class IIb bacteriocin, lactobin A/cerein 7B family [Lactobacillus sp. LL6]